MVLVISHAPCSLLQSFISCWKSIYLLHTEKSVILFNIIIFHFSNCVYSIYLFSATPAQGIVAKIEMYWQAPLEFQESNHTFRLNVTAKDSLTLQNHWHSVIPHVPLTKTMPAAFLTLFLTTYTAPYFLCLPSPLFTDPSQMLHPLYLWYFHGKMQPSNL